MDVEKTMQFLLAQQARFDARQAEFVEQFVEQQGQSQERMTRIESVLLDVATAQTRTNAILTTLTERHVELAESHMALAESHMALTEAQKVTQQNLNALIATLERHIANHN